MVRTTVLKEKIEAEGELKKNENEHEPMQAS